MALTIALLGTATWNTTGGNTTVVAAPTVSDLIVVVTGTTGVAGGTTAVSDNQTPAGTYTKLGSDFTGFSTTGHLSAWVRNFLIGSNASTTFTATQASSTGGGLAVYRIAIRTYRGPGGYSWIRGPVDGNIRHDSSASSSRARGKHVLRHAGGAHRKRHDYGRRERNQHRRHHDPLEPRLYARRRSGLQRARHRPRRRAHQLRGYCLHDHLGRKLPSAFASLAIEVDASTPIYDDLGYNIDDPGATITRLSVMRSSVI